MAGWSRYSLAEKLRFPVLFGTILVGLYAFTVSFKNRNNESIVAGGRRLNMESTNAEMIEKAKTDKPTSA